MSYRDGIAVLPGSLYYQKRVTVPPPSPGCIHWNPLDDLPYVAYDSDFGPSHIGHVVQFSRILHNKLETGSVVEVYCHGPKEAAKCVVLLGCYLIFRCQLSAPDAYAPFAHLVLPPFPDIAGNVLHEPMGVLDVLTAVSKALQLNFFTFAGFDVSSYNYMERVVNGNINWLVPDRLLAFAGPSALGSTHNPHPPSFYLPLFRKMGVSTVVRLNEPNHYSSIAFTAAEVAHFDLFFPDGGLPPDDLMQRFIRILDEAPGAVAVHCTAGLGRTGTMALAYLIRQYKFSAMQGAAWIRLCRPGSILAPQLVWCKRREAALLSAPIVEPRAFVPPTNHGASSATPLGSAHPIPPPVVMVSSASTVRVLQLRSKTIVV